MDADGFGRPSAFAPCPDPTAADNAQPAYYTMLLHGGTNQIKAFGNRWIPSNQGTDSNGWMTDCGATCTLGGDSDTCCSGSPPSVVCSTSMVGVNYEHVATIIDSSGPHPITYEYDGPSPYWDGNGECRNYCIKDGGGSILFGASEGSCPMDSTAAACTNVAPSASCTSLPSCP